MRNISGAGIALVSNGSLLWCAHRQSRPRTKSDISCDPSSRRLHQQTLSSLALKLEEEPHQSAVRFRSCARSSFKILESTNPVRITNLLEHTAGLTHALREFTTQRLSLNSYSTCQEIPIADAAGRQHRFAIPIPTTVAVISSKKSASALDDYYAQHPCSLEISAGDFDSLRKIRTPGSRLSASRRQTSNCRIQKIFSARWD